MQSNAFEGKVALITGSSRGIGSAIARKLALSGADVALNFRKAGGSSQAQGEKLLKEITEMGRRSFLIQADISQKESVKKLFDEINEKFGQLDLLILNAAKAPFKPIEKLLERELRQLVETNYLGNIFCIQQALPLLKKNGGKVVFISSLGSRFYNPSYPLGNMKAAMESVVRDCAESLGEENISVNAVCGGIVKTDSFKVLRLYWEEISLMPDELFVEPDEIADAVMFLCGEASRGIRGQTIVVDRGFSNRLYRPAEKKK
ncbi:enoyl-[acyl-carrier-protein] reductase [NADPH] FabL [bacterium BMS3Bbin08]|nr:enoyl-[acyl-carrier-protein] reductase [NADPH] FabL [bacterium BMS3Bbin08]